VQIGLMAAGRALVDDRDGMVALGAERRRGRGVLHSLHGLGHDDRMAVERAGPERPAAGVLLGRLLERGDERTGLAIHRALHDDRPRRWKFGAPRRTRDADNGDGGRRDG